MSEVSIEQSIPVPKAELPAQPQIPENVALAHGADQKVDQPPAANQLQEGEVRLRTDLVGELIGTMNDIMTIGGEIDQILKEAADKEQEKMKNSTFLQIGGKLFRIPVKINGEGGRIYRFGHKGDQASTNEQKPSEEEPIVLAEPLR